MNLKRLIIYILIFNFLILFGTKSIFKIQTVKNQNFISRTLKLAKSDPKTDYAEKIKHLLNLKSLNNNQKATLYNELSAYFFQHNQMENYLESIGYALFYNELCNNKEQQILLYSQLAQYYFEIGADQSGYEMILTARHLKNFYKIEDPIIRSQALHAYGRFLVYESDFEDAIKAELQMEKDATIIRETNSELSVHCLRRALAFKAYIMLMQGKTEEAYKLASETYEKYFRNDEELSHIIVYDFFLPVFLVKTQWAIRNKNYKQALEFNREYGKAARKSNFITKKATLSKEVMFALPADMIQEKEHLFTELAFDADIIAQTFLENYTSLTSKKLNSIIEKLRQSNENSKLKIRILNSSFITILIFGILLLIILVIYSETQTDGLTKLKNRRALNIRIGKFAQSEKKYSAIMIDIDNFKKLNDNYGHDFGDEVLRGIAALLLKNETKNIKCYRYGGEEMVIMLDHFDFEHAVRFCEHIRKEISILKWRNNVHVTASLGLGFETPNSIKEADENMYIAKQKGKNLTAYKRDGKQFLAERRLDIRNPMPDKF